MQGAIESLPGPDWGHVFRRGITTCLVSADIAGSAYLASSWPAASGLLPLTLGSLVVSLFFLIVFVGSYLVCTSLRRSKEAREGD